MAANPDFHHNYVVGEKHLIKGTGTWWAGFSYPVTVIDVRESDNTIKVQFNDGGYKRFSRNEFENLIVFVGKDLEYGSEAFEYHDEHYDPAAEVMQEYGTLRQDLQKAIQEKKWLEAHKLQSSIKEHEGMASKIRTKKKEMIDAVAMGEFMKAHELQAELEELQIKPEAETKPVNFSEIMNKASKRALGGGLAGATAMLFQVCSMMWLRTTMNYQYRYGTNTRTALQKLYADGGVRRFYRGIGPALAQGPMARFGDTAANTGILTLLNSHPATVDMPVGIKSLCASLCAASWRLFLMPIDTVKTTLQVEGRQGLEKVKAKARAGGPRVMYHGGLAACTATFVGHYPWFATYNFLDSKIAIPDDTLGKLGRNAFMGFTSSVVSDCTSNSVRVIKTYRQTKSTVVPYPQAIREVIAKDGVLGLMGRGLQTRILANGMQGIMFSVLWKFFDGKFKGNH